MAVAVADGYFFYTFTFQKTGRAKMFIRLIVIICMVLFCSHESVGLGVDCVTGIVECVPLANGGGGGGYRCTVPARSFSTSWTTWYKSVASCVGMARCAAST